MNDLVPSGRRIDSVALQRIIQRAAELQAQERDVGDGLTEHELLQLGEEVGILPAHLRRALQEERTGVLAASGGGMLDRLVGPRRIAAERMVRGTREVIERAIQQWMTEGELLQVKRRYPDRMSWERKEGAWASLRRSFGAGGRKYTLSRAREVVTQVVEVDGDKCLVQLIADLSNTRNEYMVGGGAVIGVGVLNTGVALVLGVMVPVAMVPVALGVPIAVAIARSRRRQIEDFQVALEQILDRLQHGDLDVQKRQLGSGIGVVDRIAEEIRKNL